MAKKNTQQPQEQFKTMIGGQALIEGIMMLGPEKSAVVVRTKDGLQRKVERRSGRRRSCRSSAASSISAHP